MRTEPIPAGLAEHARRFYAEGRTAVVPRRAATVVLLRDAPGGPEVFLVRRRTTMPFASGMYAFPGGSVDPRDGAEPAGAPWVGPDPESWARMLGLPGEVRAAREVVAAAVREMFEETGVLFAGAGADSLVGDVLAGAGPTLRPGSSVGAGSPASAGPGPAAGAVAGPAAGVDAGPLAGATGSFVGDVDWSAARVSLVERRVSLSELLTERRLSMRADLLHAWARWITPEFEPRRYDTFFFLAELPAGQTAREVGGEADRIAWVRPADALAGREAGELGMLPPTVAVLESLSSFERVAAALAATAPSLAPVQPRVEWHADGARLVL
ncbi:NUDIX hydrolase [Actinocatenispora sera]|uniref:NUDIX hydrolase n=1 Tax=Actinocatenispora sera TaxID=390989 RepID=UPI0033E357FA